MGALVLFAVYWTIVVASAVAWWPRITALVVLLLIAGLPLRDADFSLDALKSVAIAAVLVAVAAAVAVVSTRSLPD